MLATVTKPTVSHEGHADKKSYKLAPRLDGQTTSADMFTHRRTVVQALSEIDVLECMRADYLLVRPFRSATKVGSIK